MNLKLIVTTVAVACVAMSQAAADKVIGYFPYWSQYSQFYPKDIRYNTVTHIHYSSLTPGEDGAQLRFPRGYVRGEQRESRGFRWRHGSRR